MAIKKVYYNENDGDEPNELTAYRNKDGNLYINIDGDNGGVPFHFITVPMADVPVLLKDLCNEFGLIEQELEGGRTVVCF